MRSSRCTLTKESVMRKMAVLLLVFTFFNINSFAQESEIDPEIVDFVNNSEVVPDYTNQGAGWIFLGEKYFSLELTSRNTVVRIKIVEKLYMNVNNGLRVKLFSIPVDIGLEQIYGMSYGVDAFFRYAVPLEHRWILAKEPFTEDNKNGIYTFGFDFDEELGPISVTMALDTVEGIKKVVVKFNSPEDDEFKEEQKRKEEKIIII